MSKQCTPLWREAHFQVNMYKTPPVRSTFGSCDVEKAHAVAARSTCPSQNVQNTPCSDHFWKLRCRKSARRCGGKHISKSKCTKHTMFGPLLEVEISKKCTPLWREAHFQVKMLKHHVRSTFGRSDVVSRGRRKGIVHLVKSERNVRVLLHFQLQPPLHHTTLQYTTLQLQQHFHYIPLHYTTVHSTTLQLHYTTFHYTTLHYTTLHSTTLHYITLHHPHTPLHYNYTTLHSTSLHYTPLHSATLHSITLHYTTLHYTTLRSTTLHYTTLNYTTLHYIPLHYTTLTTATNATTTILHLHYATLHYTNYTTLRSTTLH